MSNRAVALLLKYGDSCGGVAAGGNHTCVLTSNGNVDCYGNNYYGQAVDYTDADAVGVSAGGDHTCVLTSNGNVDCYGNNYYGQAVDYTNADAVGVSAGRYHTCVLTAGGNVHCYGFNDFAQAVDYSDGDAAGVSAGRYHTCVLTVGGNVDCYGYGSLGQSNDYSNGDAVGVAAGGFHTCVLTSNGNVDCYGNNSNGQAVDYTGGDAVGVSAGWYHTCVLTSGGNMYCYGSNSWDQVIDYTGGDAVGVSAGASHTCLLTSGGNIDCYPSHQTGDFNNGDATCAHCFRFFKDVALDYWAMEHISAIACADISKGYADNSYKPKNLVNRAQMAAYIVQAVDKTEPPACTVDPFTDISSGFWACKYIKRANELGIVSGFPDGNYKPTQVVNRGQMAAFISKGMIADGQLPGEPKACVSDPFPDVPSDHTFCKYIREMVNRGIASGFPEGTYGPTQQVNRAQLAVFISRAFLGMQ